MTGKAWSRVKEYTTIYKLLCCPPTPPTASVGAGYSCHHWTTYHARGATVKPNLRWCCLLLLVWQICVWPVTTHCTDSWHWENGGLCALENVPLPQFTDSEYTFPQDLDKVFNCGWRILYQVCEILTCWSLAWACSVGGLGPAAGAGPLR